MDNTETKGLESPEHAVDGFVSEVLEGACVDVLINVPEGAEERLVSREGLRNKAFEVFADGAFYRAAKRLLELMEDEDPTVAVKAASKIVDMRRDVYKTQSTKKQVKAVMDKLFDDGFDF
jgi:hypothetical protein